MESQGLFHTIKRQIIVGSDKKGITYLNTLIRDGSRVVVWVSKCLAARSNAIVVYSNPCNPASLFMLSLLLQDAQDSAIPFSTKPRTSVAYGASDLL